MNSRWQELAQLCMQKCDKGEIAEIIIQAVKPFRDALTDLVGTDDTPGPNCSCHISPPCNDCVQYGARRIAMEEAERVLHDNLLS